MATDKHVVNDRLPDGFRPVAVSYVTNVNGKRKLITVPAKTK